MEAAARRPGRSSRHCATGNEEDPSSGSARTTRRRASRISPSPRPRRPAEGRQRRAPGGLGSPVGGVRRRRRRRSRAQRAIRFALFHLIGSAGDRGEAAVGARGLTGPALPRARLLGQRRLRAPVPRRDPPGCGARDAAVPTAPPPCPAEGCTPARSLRGAIRVESAADGIDVTPSAARLATGELARIRTGEREEHRRRRCLGGVLLRGLDQDTAFAAVPGQPLFVETARYWVSRPAMTAPARHTSTA